MENLFYKINYNVKFENVDISSVTTTKNVIRNRSIRNYDIYYKNINASNILKLNGMSSYLNFLWILFLKT